MRRRTLALRILAALGLLVMAGRLAWFQVIKAEEVLGREEEWRLQQESLTPLRGALKDRAGRYMAVSIPTRDVVAAPLHVGAENFTRVAQALSQFLPIPADELERRFREKPTSQYLPLTKGIDLAAATQIQELRLPGISLLPGAKRTYPQGSVANQLIGYLDSEGKGSYGLEAFYDKQLSGKPGFVRAEMTHEKVPIAGTVKSQIDPEPGLDLTLTLDAYLNQTFEAAIDRVMKKEEAKRGLAIAMDIHTGEILAMAMRPGADLNDRKTWLAPDGSPDYGRINNWAVTPLPPGSIFKTITTSIALEEGLIGLNTLIPDSGRLDIDGWTIFNWDRYIPVEPKPMTIAELLQTSSNVGLINVGERIPHKTFEEYLKRFGFMETTGLDFPHEDSATGVTGMEAKSRIDWANIYIGQHLEVTPLQMVRAAAAIANGGYLVEPHLVKEMRDPTGKVVWQAETKSTKTAISAQTAAEVQQLMVSVIEERYQTAKVDGYLAGGKTGTAQKYEGGKEKDRGVADFIGFAPASNPQVVLMVLFDEPKPPGYGGTIAAPVFGELMPHVLRTLGIPPEQPVKSPPPNPPQASSTPQAVVPDLRYLPVAWAEQKLKDAGFTPRRLGEGTLVVGQSIAPGGRERAGAVIELQLAPKPTDKLPVPDLRGLTLAEASRLGSEIGLTLKQSGGSGFVVEQSAAPGSSLEAGGVVTVRLSPTRP